MRGYSAFFKCRWSLLGKMLTFGIMTPKFSTEIASDLRFDQDVEVMISSRYLLTFKKARILEHRYFGLEHSNSIGKLGSTVELGF